MCLLGLRTEGGGSGAMEDNVTGDPLSSLFDPDPERAREQFDRLNARLTYYFRARRCHAPEELASETIYRALRRLSTGSTGGPDLTQFCWGIARQVLLEYRRKRDPDPILYDLVDNHQTVSQREQQILLDEFLGML